MSGGQGLHGEVTGPLDPLPFCLDVGAGDSDLTWQAAAGVSDALIGVTFR